MIPDAPLPPEDDEFLTDAGKREWRRFMDTMEHRVLDIDAHLIADYADALAYLTNVADIVGRRGAVEIQGDKAAEASTIRMLEDAIVQLRRIIAKMDIDQPLPETITVHGLTKRISRN